MNYLGSEYGILLQGDLRRSLIGETQRRSKRKDWFARVVRGPGRSIAVLAAATVCAFAITIVSVSVGYSAQANDVPSNIELAQAFTEALNAHDVEALVELFTEDDSGPTVNADRYAWQKFEIRLWAQQQATAKIHVTAYDFQLTENGAFWYAEVFREDWQEWGVSLLPVTNTIWVHDGKLANFTSILRDGRDAERLSGLWLPGSSPRR